MIDDVEYLNHILEAGRRVRDYTQAGRSSFESELLVQDGVVRNLEVIGEAVKNLSASLRREHADIPWKLIAVLRDTLIHRYFLVQLDLIWDVVENHLPPLIVQVEANRAKLDATPQNTSQDKPDSSDAKPT